MSDDLEKEFKQLKKQVKEKMLAASKLINEAAKLVAKSGQVIYCDDASFSYSRESTIDLDKDIPMLLLDPPFETSVRPLMIALEKAGWSPSSMECPD